MPKTSTEFDNKNYLKRCAQALEGVLDQVLPMLAIGHTRTACAKAMGIKPDWFHAVCREGRLRKGRCHDMLVKIMRAEGQAQVMLEKLVIGDAAVNVKTAQWLLARRFRLKERHEADIDVLRKLDENRLNQEEVKLAILEQKLRLLQERNGDDMTADDWRALMSEAKGAKERLKSLH
jgi:hypothetical protein